MVAQVRLTLLICSIRITCAYLMRRILHVLAQHRLGFYLLIVDIYDDENKGIARNATVYVADVPVFWSPYFTFPVKQENEQASSHLPLVIHHVVVRILLCRTLLMWHLIMI